MFDAILEAIRTHIVKNPTAPALITTAGVMRFGELGARIQGIIDILATIPPGPQLIIGHKEPDCVAAMLACISTGRPFVFADRSSPTQRTLRVAAVTGASGVLSAVATDGLADLPIVQLKAVPGRAYEAGGLHVDEDQALYIIFTSGSSGEPKGVPISRRNFAALHSWYSPKLDAVRPAGGHVNHSNLAFDMGMFDLWPALALGRAVFLLDHGNNILPHNNICHLRSCGEVSPCSWASTPSLLQLMCTDAQFSDGLFPDLRWFVIGGEMIPRSLVGELMTRFPRATILNGYGPSEATCATHLHPLSAADAENEGPMPLGPVINPSTMRILGEDGCELAAGQAGEVELSGPQVISHYLPPDHPANAALGWRDGQRTYRTGDLGRVDEQGRLTLLGRIDRQVKWLGNRIELDEIERIADGLPAVKKSACLPQRERERVAGIVLFIQLRPGARTTRAEVAEHLVRHLPLAMVPRDLRFVEQLPVTLNGKLDGRALLAGTPAV